MASVVIVSHSGYGHTAKQAEAVVQGVGSVDGAVASHVVIDAEGNLPPAGWDALVAADAMIFGSPTYIGSVSWQFKKFADASSKQWAERVWVDKIAAGFTNSAGMNGDKLSTLHYFITLAMQHGMVWIGTGMMPAYLKTSQRNDVNYLASAAGAIAQSPADASAEEAPPPGDLETARQFGARVAAYAVKVRG